MQVAQALFIFICCALWFSNVKQSIMAIVLSSVSCSFAVFFGGYFQPANATEWYWQWAQYWAPAYYSITALFRIGLEDYLLKDCNNQTTPELSNETLANATCARNSSAPEVNPVCAPTVAEVSCFQDSSGDALLAVYGYQDVVVYDHVLALFLMYIGYLALSFLLLELEARGITAQTLWDGLRRLVRLVTLESVPALSHVLIDSGQKAIIKIQGMGSSSESQKGQLLTLSARHRVNLARWHQAKTTRLFKIAPSANYEVREFTMDVKDNAALSTSAIKAMGQGLDGLVIYHVGKQSLFRARAVLESNGASGSGRLAIQRKMAKERRKFNERFNEKLMGVAAGGNQVMRLMSSAATEVPGVLTSAANDVLRENGVVRRLSSAATEVPGVLTNVRDAATEVPGMVRRMSSAAAEVPGQVIRRMSVTGSDIPEGATYSPSGFGEDSVANSTTPSWDN